LQYRVALDLEPGAHAVNGGASKFTDFGEPWSVLWMVDEQRAAARTFGRTEKQHEPSGWPNNPQFENTFLVRAPYGLKALNLLKLPRWRMHYDSNGRVTHRLSRLSIRDLPIEPG
jgi:hypothetical protein